MKKCLQKSRDQSALAAARVLTPALTMFWNLWEENKSKRFLDKLRMAYNVGRGMGLSRKNSLLFVSRAFSKYKKFRKNPQMVPGAIPTLKRLLSSGYKIGVISSTHRKDVDMSFSHLKDLFDMIICKEDIKNLKLAPNSILKACNRLNPIDIIYIGDFEYDILAASNSGATPVLFIMTFDLLGANPKINPENKIHKLEGYLKF